MYCVLHTAVYTPCDTWLGGTPVSTVHWTIIVGGGCSWLFTSRHALSKSIILGLHGSAQHVQDRQVLQITLSKSLIRESGMPFYMLLLFGRGFMACWDQQHGRLIQYLCVNVNEVTIVTMLICSLEVRMCLHCTPAVSFSWLGVQVIWNPAMMSRNRSQLLPAIIPTRSLWHAPTDGEFIYRWSSP